MKRKRTRRPDRPFRTDGCTLWPDGNKARRRCCVFHDYLYWLGGTWRDRWLADAALYDCVRRDEPGIAAIMWVGVRLFGSPFWPFRWRFGWGHRWPRWK